MARIVIVPDANLARFSNALASLSETDARRAMARAVNRVTNTVYGRVVRAIRRQSNIPASIIRRSLKKKLASVRLGGGAIEGVISSTGAPIPLKHFQARQFSWGVRTKEGGGFRRYPGMFIYAGTWRSGNPVGGGHVFQNTRGYNSRSGRNNAVAMQTGTSVPEELVAGESKRVFEETVATMLPQRIRHEIGRLLP